MNLQVIRGFLHRFRPPARGRSFKDLFSRMAEEINLGDAECGLDERAHADVCGELFLNRFTESEMRAMIRETGLGARLSKLGYRRLSISIGRDENMHHRLRIFSARSLPEQCLVDLRLSEIVLMPRWRVLPRALNVIGIEWMSAVHPLGSFTKKRPRLPGQRYPGFGFLPFLVDLMERIGRAASRDAVMAVPDHAHLAAIYSPFFRFLDPAKEGFLRGVLRGPGAPSLGDFAWGFATGAMLDKKTGEPVLYEPGEQLLPLSKPVNEYFASAEYASRADKATREREFILDVPSMKARRRALLRDREPDEL